MNRKFPGEPIARMPTNRLPIALGALLLLFIAAMWVARNRIPDAPKTVAIAAMPSVETSNQAALKQVLPTTPVPPAHESVVTQLRLGSDPGNFLETLRQVPGVTQASFDAKTSNLVISHQPNGPLAGKLAELTAQAGLDVKGEVMDLPLAFGEKSHVATCGSCGFEVYESLRKKPGVHAVEVFLPIENQLRLLVVPESITPSEIDRFIAEPRHAATPP